MELKVASQRTHITITVLIFSVFFAMAGSITAPANASAPASYVVQLKSDDAAVLQQAGTDVRHRFVFSHEQQFRNIYTFRSVYSLEELQRRFGSSVVSLEPLGQMQEETVTVNDPGFTLNPRDIDKQWGLTKAGFPIAWEKTTGTATATVAIIDTGIDFTHEDLQGIRKADGFDFVANQPLRGDVNSDDNGHGTLIAGILAAVPNNNKGIAGGAWNVTVMPLKALDAEGRGDAATVAEAIVWATDHKASIINISLGGSGFSHDAALASAISYAFGKGVVIVAAAGNDVATTGGDLDAKPVFPICNDNDQNMVIGVAAVDQNDLKPTFSNYGKNCIDVSAPGKRILSTINHEPVNNNLAPNSYAYVSGTSLAAPFVSAEAVLLKAMYPTATNIQIRDRIVSAVDPIDDLNLTQCGGGSCKGKLGTGRINVVKALQSDLVTAIMDGDLVKSQDSDAVYQIAGGQRRLVSSFVYNQRFFGIGIKIVSQAKLSMYPEGAYATPLENTLVKGISDGTVYIISKGLKQPVTYQVFQQRGFKFSDVNTVSYPEVSSWITGPFLAPTDGTLVRGSRGQTVYWVVAGALHPINRGFYLQRGLNVFPLFIISDKDVPNYPKGEAYIL